MPADSPWWSSFYTPRLGFIPWPVVGPLPSWLSGPLLGLISSLAGCGLGVTLRWICCGRFVGGAEPGGPIAAYDDGGVLALAGSFLGWQPVLVGSALAFVVALTWRFAVRRGRVPFSLLAGVAVLASWLGWTWLTPWLAPICFSLSRSAVALAVVAGLAFGVRRLAGKAPTLERQTVE
jgi:hypothetical protein